MKILIVFRQVSISPSMPMVSIINLCAFFSYIYLDKIIAVVYMQFISLMSFQLCKIMFKKAQCNYIVPYITSITLTCWLYCQRTSRPTSGFISSTESRRSSLEFMKTFHNYGGLVVCIVMQLFMMKFQVDKVWMICSMPTF